MLQHSLHFDDSRVLNEVSILTIIFSLHQIKTVDTQRQFQGVSDLCNNRQTIEGTRVNIAVMVSAVNCLRHYRLVDRTVRSECIAIQSTKTEKIHSEELCRAVVPVEAFLPQHSHVQSSPCQQGQLRSHLQSFNLFHRSKSISL